MIELSDKLYDTLLHGNESESDREGIKAMAALVLGKNLTRGCRNCYLDAFIEMRVALKNNPNLLKNMEAKKFQIKRGVCLPLGFGTGRFIVYQNCTDEIALEALAINPERISHFEKYPENWEELLAEHMGEYPKPEQKPEPDEDSKESEQDEQPKDSDPEKDEAGTNNSDSKPEQKPKTGRPKKK